MMKRSHTSIFTLVIAISALMLLMPAQATHAQESSGKKIAATNKDLKAEIEKGNFREDLYHRLSVIVLHVPSLDERKDDIPLLVNYFIDQVSNESGMQPKSISDDAMKMLQDRSWTGNIRELRNVVERLMILGGNPVTPQDIKDYVIF